MDVFAAAWKDKRSVDKASSADDNVRIESKKRDKKKSKKAKKKTKGAKGTTKKKEEKEEEEAETKRSREGEDKFFTSSYRYQVPLHARKTQTPSRREQSSTGWRGRNEPV